MRQRRVKNRSLLLQLCSKYIYLGRPVEGVDAKNFLSEDMPELKPLPSKDMPGIPEGKPFFLEIGSGKGQFLTRKAVENPDSFFLACEGGININIRIMQKAEELGLTNLLVINEYITRLSTWFNEETLDGIYINFCDPWPKDRHEKRRLTHRENLAEYIKVLKPNGFIEFKTDNDDLFEFSLEEFKAAGLKTVELTRDLYASEYKEKNTPTEYEEKFAMAGKNISYIRLSK